jgi:hypothetical protein
MIYFFLHEITWKSLRLTSFSEASLSAKKNVLQPDYEQFPHMY